MKKSMLLLAFLAFPFSAHAEGYQSITFKDLLVQSAELGGKPLEVQARIMYDRSFPGIADLEAIEDPHVRDSVEIAYKDLPADLKTKVNTCNVSDGGCLAFVRGRIVVDAFYPNGKFVVDAIGDKSEAGASGDTQAATCPPSDDMIAIAHSKVVLPKTPMPVTVSELEGKRTMDQVNGAVARGIAEQSAQFDMLVEGRQDTDQPVESQFWSTPLAGLYKTFPYRAGSQWPRVALSFTGMPPFGNEYFASVITRNLKATYTVKASLWCDAQSKPVDVDVTLNWPQDIVKNVPYANLSAWGVSNHVVMLAASDRSGATRSFGPQIPDMALPDGFDTTSANAVAIGSVLYMMGFETSQNDGRVWVKDVQ